jgi:hypothetical protein
MFQFLGRGTLDLNKYFFFQVGGGGHLRLESSCIWVNKVLHTCIWSVTSQPQLWHWVSWQTVLMVFLSSSRHIPAFIIPTYYSATILLYTLCVWGTNKCYKINHKKIYIDNGDGSFHWNVSTYLPDFTTQEFEDSNPHSRCKSQISQAVVCAVA